MLYATTRSNSHVETTYRALHLERCSDGGLFIPFRMPQIEKEQIAAMKDRTFGENAAQILNIFFGCNMNGLDVDFATGRNLVQLQAIPHRIVIAEAWHCSSGKFDQVVQTLFQRICGDDAPAEITNWAKIGIRIAILFATYGALMSAEMVDVQMPLDIAVPTGDFTVPMAAWYARQMGLPLGNIICGCNANGAVWDLIHRGILSTNQVCVNTNTPDMDMALPVNLERLMEATLGKEYVHVYLDKCRMGQQLTLKPEQTELLRSGLFASVISDSRVTSVIHNTYRTNGYVFGPYAALTYGSLLDYRAKTSESRQALLWSERSPVCDCQIVAKSMDTNEAAVISRIRQI